MEANRLRPADRVQVQISDDTRRLGRFEGTGYHNIEEAVEAAYEAEHIEEPREDLVYTVTDMTTGTTERYRFNAHGHLRLIV